MTTKYAAYLSLHVRHARSKGGQHLRKTACSFATATAVLALFGSTIAVAEEREWAVPAPVEFDRNAEPIEEEFNYNPDGPRYVAPYLDQLRDLESRRGSEAPVELHDEIRGLLAQAEGDAEQAKNIILFVGDGMGISTVTAARILEGQMNGWAGEENSLFFELFPHTSMSKVYNYNQQVPDSAGTMTAMMTGIKTKAGVIGVGPAVRRGDHRTVPGNELTSLLMDAELRGRSTGVVSTARLTHATPAACYAHSPERNWEADSDMTEEALLADFPDIARQLIEFPIGDGLEVAMGGGRRNFLPDTMEDPEDAGSFGERADGRNLPEEWLTNYPNAAYAWNKVDFDTINPAETDHFLGLFERSHMEYEYDRELDTGGEPSLSEMTDKALRILSKNDKGFFLHVESGRIDHAHHSTNSYRSLTETIEFANAIQTAVESVDLSETLIIVTADHSHVFTIAGYPTRGNPILGKVIGNDETGEPAPDFSRDANGLVYATVSYANGPGPSDRPDLELVDTEDPEFLQEVMIPLSSETHSGEDVAIYAVGPNADAFQGTVEQSAIYQIMVDALVGQ